MSELVRELDAEQASAVRPTGAQSITQPELREADDCSTQELDHV
jgi:hypothetical protein